MNAFTINGDVHQVTRKYRTQRRFCYWINWWQLSIEVQLQRIFSDLFLINILPSYHPLAPAPLSFLPLICNTFNQWIKLHICASDRIQRVAECFPRKSSNRGMKLTTHFHPLPSLRMSGAIPLTPHMPSWRGQGKIYLPLYLYRSGATPSCHFCNLMKTLVSMEAAWGRPKLH
jgi:hypothetical protein